MRYCTMPESDMRVFTLVERMVGKERESRFPTSTFRSLRQAVGMVKAAARAMTAASLRSAII